MKVENTEFKRWIYESAQADLVGLLDIRFIPDQMKRRSIELKNETRSDAVIAFVTRVFHSWISHAPTHDSCSLRLENSRGQLPYDYCPLFLNFHASLDPSRVSSKESICDTICITI